MVRDLAKSMLRFSWTAGFFGASQMAEILRPRGGAAANGARRVPGLDAVAWAARGELGEMLQAAYQAGDDLQEEWVEILGDSFRPWRWQQTAVGLAGRSRHALRFASPGAGGEACRQELKNKFEVYWLVKGVRKLLGLPPAGQPFPLRPFVERAYELDAYRALWVVEGLGHDYVENALGLPGPPVGLLRGEAVEGLPANSLPMLHGGLGLACAEHVLSELTPDSDARCAAAAIERFAALCRDNAMERFADSALEALGLDARCFFPDLVPVLERGFEALDDPVLHRYFWHGVGRAIYFLPVNFIPGYGSLQHAVEMAEREAPHAVAHDNALAGVSYAFTMVNMSHPVILEGVLATHGEALRSTAFASGLVAAVVMRHEITPDAPVLGGFIDHRPEARVAALWRDLVRDPCRRALASGADAYQALENAEIYRSMPRSEAAP